MMSTTFRNAVILLMEQFGGIGVAAAVVLILSPLARPLVLIATSERRPEAPPGIAEDRWRRVTSMSGIGRWLGLLEAFVSLVAFWSEAHVIIAGWLAFKVASKWENWRNVIQVPTHLEGVGDTDYLIARAAWGNWIYTRFVFGTGISLMIGMVAAYLGKQTGQLLT